MRHTIKFENPLTIEVNVSVTQKQDDRVIALEKELSDLKKEISDSTNNLNTGSADLQKTIDENK